MKSETPAKRNDRFCVCGQQVVRSGCAIAHHRCKIQPERSPVRRGLRCPARLQTAIVLWRFRAVHERFNDRADSSSPSWMFSHSQALAKVHLFCTVRSVTPSSPPPRRWSGRQKISTSPLGPVPHPFVCSRSKASSISTTRSSGKVAAMSMSSMLTCSAPRAPL